MIQALTHSLTSHLEKSGTVVAPVSDGGTGRTNGHVRICRVLGCQFPKCVCSDNTFFVRSATQRSIRTILLDIFGNIKVLFHQLKDLQRTGTQFCLTFAAIVNILVNVFWDVFGHCCHFTFIQRGHNSSLLFLGLGRRQECLHSSSAPWGGGS
jgi:hypothetical protein